MQKLKRLLGFFGWRRIEPGEVAPFSHGEKLEQRFGEVAAEDFRRVGGGAGFVGGFFPQSPAHARGGATRAASTLVGRGLRNGYEFEPRQACGRAHLQLAGLARIHHRSDTVDRKRSFRHIRGEDDFTAADVVEHLVLGFGRKIAVERHESVAGTVDKRSDGTLATHDLTDTRQEDEHMAGRFAERERQLLGDVVFDRLPLATAAQVTNFDGEAAAFGVNDRAIAEKFCHRVGSQRGTHHHDSQVGPQCLADANQESECEIHFNRTFVELVEDDGTDAFERDVVEQAAQEDAGRRHDEPRIAADLNIKANVVANFAANFAAAQMRDAASDCAGSEASRLHEGEFLVAWQVVENGSWDKHRFARARRGGDDGSSGSRGRNRFR